jgi:hypothetical protein
VFVKPGRFSLNLTVFPGTFDTKTKDKTCKLYSYNHKNPLMSKRRECNKARNVDIYLLRRYTDSNLKHTYAINTILKTIAVSAQ